MNDPVEPGDRAAANLALDTKADATNRGVRTALQFLVVGIVVDLIPDLLSFLDTEEADWGELGKTIIRVTLGGLSGFLMRYVAPPPAPQG